MKLSLWHAAELRLTKSSGCHCLAGGASELGIRPPLPLGFQCSATPSGNCKYVAACPQHGEASICKLWNLKQYLSTHSAPRCRCATDVQMPGFQTPGPMMSTYCMCCAAAHHSPLNGCRGCRPEWAHLCQGMQEDKNAYKQRLQQHGFMFGPAPLPQEGPMQGEQAEAVAMEEDAPEEPQPAGSEQPSLAQAASSTGWDPSR